MKISAIFFSLLIIVGLSCNKHNFNYPKDTVASSKVIYFPIIASNGDKIAGIIQHASYTDPGATATLNGATTTYTTDGAVDPNTPGVYTVTYTAANPQGYTASDWRMVVVVPATAAADPVVIANDFSGVYLRAATGVTSTWTKLVTGAYKVENPGGSTGVGEYVIATNYSGTTIAIPDQIAPSFGEVSSSSESYSVGPPATYSWIFHANGYGTGTRTFVKQ